MPIDTVKPRITDPNPSALAPAIPLPFLPANDLMPKGKTERETSIASAAMHGTDFQFGEAKSVVAAGRNVIDFAVPFDLPRRKVYALIVCEPSVATDYVAECYVEFWKNFSKVGQLPISECVSAAASAIKQSPVTAFVAGGIVTPDSIALVWAEPSGAQATGSQILQPQCVVAHIDRVTFSVNRMFAVTSLRAWIGVMSSEA